MLNSIRGPADLRHLPAAELPALADEIREFPVRTVSRTGGHLGPNLGVVELAIALHLVFESPRDRILWDTGTTRTPPGATAGQPGTTRGCKSAPATASGRHFMSAKDRG